MTTDGIILRHPRAEGVRIAADEAWTFPEGLIGLPALRRFALVALPGAEPLRLLCSLDEPNLGFYVVDPAALVPDYALELASDDLEPLGSTDPDALEIVVLASLPADDRPFTLNLLGPIVLCPATRRGVQRASTDAGHSERYRPDPDRLVEAAERPCSS